MSGPEKTIQMLLLVTGIIAYGHSAATLERGQIFRVEVDLSEPSSIVWPCEISTVGDQGEKGLQIAPGVGRGWRGEAGGEASYKFLVPSDGRYYIWAHCLWADSCTNTVFLQIDDMEKAILGNDPIYNQWHWVKGFGVELPQGTHTLTLSNHSDHIALRKIVLTNSALPTLAGAAVVFDEIFYDGFDGCDRGNFAAWQVIEGQWSVLNMTMDVVRPFNVLRGCSEGSALIVVGDDTWEDYSVVLHVRTSEVARADWVLEVRWAMQALDRYCFLTVQPQGPTDVVEVGLGVRQGDNRIVQMKEQVPWPSEDWHRIEVSPAGGRLLASVDTEKMSVVGPAHIRGQIGLELAGRTSVDFDDVHVRHVVERR